MLRPKFRTCHIAPTMLRQSSSIRRDAPVILHPSCCVFHFALVALRPSSRVRRFPPFTLQPRCCVSHVAPVLAASHEIRADYKYPSRGTGGDGAPLAIRRDRAPPATGAFSPAHPSPPEGNRSEMPTNCAPRDGLPRNPYQLKDPTCGNGDARRTSSNSSRSIPCSQCRTSRCAHFAEKRE